MKEKFSHSTHSMNYGADGLKSSSYGAFFSKKNAIFRFWQSHGQPLFFEHAFSFSYVETAIKGVKQCGNFVKRLEEDP